MIHTFSWTVMYLIGCLFYFVCYVIIIKLRFSVESLITLVLPATPFCRLCVSILLHSSICTDNRSRIIPVRQQNHQFTGHEKLLTIPVFTTTSKSPVIHKHITTHVTFVLNVLFLNNGNIFFVLIRLFVFQKQ